MKKTIPAFIAVGVLLAGIILAIVISSNGFEGTKSSGQASEALLITEEIEIPSKPEKEESEYSVYNVDSSVQSYEIADFRFASVESAVKTLHEHNIDTIDFQINSEREMRKYDGWIVLEQFPTSGTIVSPEDKVSLVCVLLQEYLEEVMLTKSIDEAKNIAKSMGYEELVYIDEATNTDISIEVEKMDEEGCKEWIVHKVNSFGDEESKMMTLFVWQKTYNVCFRFTFASSLQLSVYDVNLLIDGELVDTLIGSQDYMSVFPLTKGEHTISLVKAENENVLIEDTINVSDNITYTGKLRTFSERIDLAEVTITDEEYLITPNVTNITLDAAIKMLEDSGFVNICYFDEKGVQNAQTAEWIVIKQTPEGAAFSDRTTEVVLTCKRAEEYFAENFLGKTLGEVKLGIDSLGYNTIQYQSEEMDFDITEAISVADTEALKLYVVDSVEHMSDFSIVVFLQFNGEVMMPFVEGMTLDKAQEVFAECELSNVKLYSNKSVNISDPEDWIVTEQKIKPGTGITKTTTVEITVLTLNDYYTELFSGKSKYELEPIIQEDYLNVKYYLENTDIDITAFVNNGTDAESKKWIVRRIEIFKDNERLTANLFVDYHAYIHMLDVSGMAANEAVQFLKDNYMCYIRVVDENGDTILELDKWMVDVQLPASGKAMWTDSEITLTCSLIPVQDEESSEVIAESSSEQSSSQSEETSSKAEESSETQAVNPYTHVWFWDIDVKREFEYLNPFSIYRKDNNIGCEERLFVSIFARPAGLTEKDFVFAFKNETISSYEVTSIENNEEANYTRIEISIYGKGTGSDQFSISTSYDAFEDGTSAEVKRIYYNMLDSYYGRTVYVSKTSAHYHIDPDCIQGEPIPVTQYDVENNTKKRYIPCQRCN